MKAIFCLFTNSGFAGAQFVSELKFCSFVAGLKCTDCLFYSCVQFNYFKGNSELIVNVVNVCDENVFLLKLCVNSDFHVFFIFSVCCVFRTKFITVT